MKKEIQAFKGDLWVCNWGYMEHRDLPRIDRVCTVHDFMVIKAIEYREKYHLNYKILTRKKIPHGEEFFTLDRGWSTGSLAVSEALERGYGRIYLAGFDFGGKDIYQPIPVYGGNFRKQFSEIQDIYHPDNIFYIKEGDFV